MRFHLIAVYALTWLLFTAAADAGVIDVIANGSFEDPTVAGQFQQFSSVPGWTGSAGIELQVNGTLGVGQGTTFGATSTPSSR